jgi:Tfp pilus assembly protein PilV
MMNILNKAAFANKKAFSYIEVLTATVMLAIIIVPVTRLLLFSSWGTRESSEYVLAYNLAADKIEHIKMLDFDKIENEENDIFTREEAEKIQDFHKFMQLYKSRYKIDFKYYDQQQGIFARTVTIDDKLDPYNSPPKIKKVTVNVYLKGSKKVLATVNTLIGE